METQSCLGCTYARSVINPPLLKVVSGASTLASVNSSTTGRLTLDYVRGRFERREIKRLTAYRNLNVLRGFTESFGNRDIKHLSRADIERWIATRAHLAPSSRRLEIATVRKFVHWLQRERIIRGDPMIDIANPIVPRRVPRSLNRDEITALYAALPDDRARAIFAMMRGLGLRRAEVLHAQIGDWDRVARTLFVIGKGDHQRILPVPDIEAATINRYLDAGGFRAGSLIRRKNGTGPISASYLTDLMRHWMTDAGIKSGAFDGRACHSLRHTLASEVAEIEPDLRVLQEILGHVSLSSTQIYVRRASLTRVRAAMEAARAG